MKFEPTTVLLKDSNSVLIREVRIEDAEQMIQTIKEYIEESEYIPYVEGEFNPSIEDEEKWIQSFIESDNSLLLLAIHNNHVIGNISLSGSQRKMLKHTAGIGMGLLKEFRGKGIGSSLLKSTINWAKKNPILEYLWLETYHTNEIGIALYKKYEFKEVGREMNFIKISPTNYVDNITMTLNVKEESKLK